MMLHDESRSNSRYVSTLSLFHTSLAVVLLSPGSAHSQFEVFTITKMKQEIALIYKQICVEQPHQAKTDRQHGELLESHQSRFLISSSFKWLHRLPSDRESC